MHDTPVDVLFLGGTVITMNPDRQILDNGGVAVRGNRIVAIGKADDLSCGVAKNVVDCTGKLILPGFIDTHAHAGHCLLRTLGVDTRSLWMSMATPTYHQYTTDDFWYTEGRLAALERLRAGVTCGVNVLSSAQRSDDPVFACNNARAYAEVGVRGVVAVGPCNPPYPRTFGRWKDGQQNLTTCDFEQAMHVTEAVIQTWNHGAGDRIRVAVAPFVLITSLFGSGPTAADLAIAPTEHDRLMMRRVRELAAKYSTRIHTEAFGGMIHMAHQDEYALLGPDVHLQHCIGLSFDETLILARTDTRVSSSPNLGQYRGRCPVPELLELGVSVAVSTDGTAPGISFDLVEAARKVQYIQQVMLQNGALLPAGKLLEMITIDAAKVLGWDDEIGSLEVGKKADIITINVNQAHLTPQLMPVHQLMLAGSGRDVDNVMVDGVFILRDNHVQSVDEQALMDEATAEAKRTVQRAGIAQHAALAPSFWGHALGRLNTKRDLSNA